LHKIKTKLGLVSLLFVLFSFSVGAYVDSPSENEWVNFRIAKKWAKQLHADHRTTFYCGCQYDKQGKIDLNSCGYPIQKDKKRAERLEWEHIMPVSFWGQDLACWQKPLCCDSKKKKCYKGRSCCEKIDIEYSKMEADLHNLVPEIGELNAMRSNYRFGLLPHIKTQQFGACEIKIDKETRRVEPQDKVRGFIARAYLYMSDRYQVHLSDSQTQLFMAWHKQYPPDAWEIERDNRIADVQGNHNHFIFDYPKGLSKNNFHF